MHWLDKLPDDIIERYSPSDVLALLRQEGILKPIHADKLNLYLLHWVMITLWHNDNYDDVLTLLTLCEIAQDLTPQTEQGDYMRKSWNGFEDLLEGKRATLAKINWYEKYGF